MSVSQVQRKPILTALKHDGAEIAPRRAGRVDNLELQLDRLRDRLRLAVIFGGSNSNAGGVIHQTINTRPWKS